MITMTPEERFERIERKLEFSAGILAQLCDSRQRQDAGIAQNSRQIAENSRQVAQLAEAVATLARVCDEQGDRIEACFKRMDERQARTDEQMKRTDERLNALISHVERRFPAGPQ